MVMMNQKKNDESDNSLEQTNSQKIEKEKVKSKRKTAELFRKLMKST